MRLPNNLINFSIDLFSYLLNTQTVFVWTLCTNVLTTVWKWSCFFNTSIKANFESLKLKSGSSDKDSEASKKKSRPKWWFMELNHEILKFLWGKKTTTRNDIEVKMVQKSEKCKIFMKKFKWNKHLRKIRNEKWKKKCCKILENFCDFSLRNFHFTTWGL